MCGGAANRRNPIGELVGRGGGHCQRDAVAHQAISTGHEIATKLRGGLHALLRIGIKVHAGARITCQRADRRILAARQQLSRQGIIDGRDALVYHHAIAGQRQPQIVEPRQAEDSRKCTHDHRRKPRVAGEEHAGAPAVNRHRSDDVGQCGGAGGVAPPCPRHRNRCDDRPFEGIAQGHCTPRTLLSSRRAGAGGSMARSG